MAGQYQAVLDQGRQRAFQHFEDQNGWKVSSKSTDLVKIESKPSDVLNCSVYRVTIYVDVSPEVAVDTYTMGPNTKRMEWDHDFKEVNLLQRLSENIIIEEIITNPVAKGIVSSRQFININATERDGDTILIFGCGLPDYQSSNDSDKVVRGMTACFLVKACKDPSNPNRTVLVMITEMDMKGKVPHSLIDSGMPAMHLQIVEKWKKYLKQKGHLPA